jgi:DNA-binding XRE family transcriptional regulator
MPDAPAGGRRVLDRVCALAAQVQQERRQKGPGPVQRMTTAEMAKLSGVAYRTMQDIEQERSEGSVQTMNRIFGMLGLKLGVARIAREAGAALSEPGAERG